jgi:hypothetical protein
MMTQQALIVRSRSAACVVHKRAAIAARRREAFAGKRLQRSPAESFAALPRGSDST